MRIINGPHPSSGHYSAAVISHGNVYISGQTSADPFTGRVTDQGIDAEMRVCLERVEHILKEVGLLREHVVMCRIFVTDMEMWREADAAYGEFFGTHCPARAVYESPHIHHGAHIEMEAVAEFPEEMEQARA